MDVDAGRFLLFPIVLFRFLSNLLVLDVPVATKAPKIVCYPYSLVPGISFDSPLFYKAISTISKQAGKMPAGSTAARKIDRLFDLSQGSSLIFLGLLNFINSFLLIIDVPASLIGDLDHDVIKRARDILTNATMVEILDEEPQGTVIFRDAVRQQVLTLCTRLRVSIVIIDKLMSIVTDLNTKIDKA
jgi:hypothetical protein